jgi:hypothetical protein
MDQSQNELERVTNQLAYYDGLIANYLDIIQQLNRPHAPDEVKILIGLANESIQHCQDKRSILDSHFHALQEKTQ